MDRISKMPFEGVLERMNHLLAEMRVKQAQAVKFVAEKKDSSYHDLVAKNLVQMEMVTCTGYLMLRDAFKAREREALVEKFVLDSLPEFNANFEKAMSNDLSTIDRHREIIDY
jgi:hypothetical protein